MPLLARRCPNGHITFPSHHLCPECGEEQTVPIDLTESVGTVVTWTTSTATSSGVRSPNTLAIVEFTIGDTTVRLLGQTTTDEIKIGEKVTPVYVEKLRSPGAGIKPKNSDQEWDGYRFDPIS